MIELTTQQSHEIKNAGWAPEFKDPDTGEVFVLLSKEMYERARAALEKEDEIIAVEEMYPLVSEVLDAENATSRASA